MNGYWTSQNEGDGCPAPDHSVTSFTETDRLDDDYDEQATEATPDMDSPGAFAVSFSAPNLPPRPEESEAEAGTEVERQVEAPQPTNVAPDIILAALAPDDTPRVRASRDAVQATDVHVLNEQPQEADPKVSLLGVEMSKRAAKNTMLALAIAILAAVIVAGVALARSVTRTGDSGENVVVVSGDLFSACDSDSDCKSFICHREKCRSDITEPVCDRLDICRTMECPNNTIPCLDANHGNICSVNHDCDSNICLQGSCASGDVGSRCGGNADCISGLCTNDSCQTRLSLGQKCTSDAQCESGNCPFGTCTFGGYRDGCTAPGHCLSEHCEDSRCGASDQGGWCVTNEGCSNLNCNIHLNKCSETLQVNEACDEDANCASGICRSGSCTSGRINNECIFNADCKSGYCYANFCKGSFLNGWCEVDEDCLSKRCDGGKCLDTVEFGAECKYNENCKDGFCDDVTEPPICAQKRGIGEICNSTFACSDGFCSAESGKCTEKLPDGALCGVGILKNYEDVSDSSLACKNGFCNRNEAKCDPKSEEGSTCPVPGSDSCLDSNCGSNSICVAPLNDGELCMGDDDCASLNCDGPTEDLLTCQPVLTVG